MATPMIDIPGSPSELELRYDPMSRDELISECERLRGKCTRQRRELRRLNKALQAIWDGVRFNISLDAAAKLQRLESLLREAMPHLHGTGLRDRIYAALPDTRT